MKIKNIIRSDFVVTGDIERDVSGVVFDSRNIKGGEVFVAIKGENFNGHDFIEDAIKMGAAAIVYENGSVDEGMRCLFQDVVWIAVDDSRKALAAISSSFYRMPSEELTVVGITGTNGKTTTSYLLKNILEISGKAVGLIGTIEYLIKDKIYESKHTTPEASNFQSLLREMADNGCDYVVSEVSSHSLAQRRVDYTRFSAAVFTNLTRDHLDFHNTMEEYFEAKKRLFTDLLIDNGSAIINLDDPYGQRLASELKDQGNKKIRIITFGVKNSGAVISAGNIKTSCNVTSFDVYINCSLFHEIEVPCQFHISSSLVGMPNVYNILAAVSAALSLNIPIEAIKDGLLGDLIIKGRFEKVDLGQNFLAVVDYAHTEDALERLLLTARHLLEESHLGNTRVITVFGCGGNRDKGKRPAMGEIATRLSDFVIITSDNPRNEDPRKIIRDIEKGIRNKDNYIVISDRAVAINMAIEMASKGDIVVVAGKGHEDYQEVKGRRYYFSDRLAIENAIRRKTKGNKVVEKCVASSR